MLWLMKFFKKKIDRTVSDSLYDEYRKTCRYTGDIPLNKEEYSKRFYELKKSFEEDD